jgi:hypothetical protein
MDKPYVQNVNRLSPNSVLNMSIGQLFNCKNTGDFSIVSSIINEISNNDTRLFINKLVRIADSDLCINILNNTDNKTFINNFKIDCINYWLLQHINNPDCINTKYNLNNFISVLNDEEILTLISNINIDQFIIIIKILGIRFDNIKNNFIPDDLEKIKYVHYNYTYSNNAIKKYILNCIYQNNNINYEIIDWLIFEFKFIMDDIDNIIRELYKSENVNQNINTIYKLIHHLLKYININKIYELLKYGLKG